MTITMATEFFARARKYTIIGQGLEGQEIHGSQDHLYRLLVWRQSYLTIQHKIMQSDIRILLTLSIFFTY